MLSLAPDSSILHDMEQEFVALQGGQSTEEYKTGKHVEMRVGAPTRVRMNLNVQDVQNELSLICVQRNFKNLIWIKLQHHSDKHILQVYVDDAVCN